MNTDKCSSPPNRRKVIRIGILVILSILVLLSIILIILFLTLVISVLGTKELVFEKPVFHKYKHLQVSRSTQESYFGILTSEKSISTFESYQDENGNYNLISNFGTKEYRCTGVCYCGGEEGKRRLALPASRGLIYLVAATSTLAAYEFAKTYFSEKCRETTWDDYFDNFPSEEVTGELQDFEEDECDESFPPLYTGEVDSCREEEFRRIIEEEVVSNTVFDEEGNPVELILDEEGNPVQVGTEEAYLCSGHCMPWGFFEWDKFQESKVEKYKKMVEEYDCTSLKMTSEVISTSEESAEIEFILGDKGMMRFCDIQSSESFSVKLAAYGEFYDDLFHLCSSFDNDAKNPSVKCRKVVKATK